ncbi:MAG: hypothetical protein HYY17_09660 [Planctomycetes bacterium]|nr:hypothetical protein [Planctomycetota bacterium]
MRLAAAALLALLSACAASSRPAAREDVRSPNRGTMGLTGQTVTPQQDVHVHVEIPAGTFGAYQLVIRWDPDVARIRSVASCPIRSFPGTPEFDPETFSRGIAKVFSTAVRARGPGEYHLLTIRFERIAAGSTRVDVIVEALYDDAAAPRRITGILSVSPREIRFE